MDEIPHAETLEEARARRSQWPVQIGRISELESDEPDLSLTTTVEERFVMMWQLAKEAWAFHGKPIGESELSRHPGCIIRRAG